jgi:hypothetical protein
LNIGITWQDILDLAFPLMFVLVIAKSKYLLPPPFFSVLIMNFTVESVSLQNDGFGWSVNDCYCRKEISLPKDATDRQLTIAAKAAMGWTGVRCYREEMGECIRLRQVASTLAVDISPIY